MPPIDLDRLKDAVRVGDVLAAHGHELRRDGRCPCPICGSQNPSTFSTYGDRARWRCWRCGAHGDVLDLERALSNVDLLTAANRLAAVAGLPVTPAARPVDRQRLDRRRQRERTLRRWAAARCLSATDALRAFDAAAHRLGATGASEIAATGTPSDATLDALAHIYRLRDLSDRDAEFFADADLGVLADDYFGGQHD